MFLVDTNVISGLRRLDKAPDSLKQWASEQDLQNIYVSVISIWELEYGILLKELKDPDQGKILREWYEKDVLPSYSGRILSVDLPAARACAPLHVPNKKSDRDSLIGATAIVNSLTIVTRNDHDFAGMNCPLLNPWKEAA